jgi:drug/metabolite transporter (DMT)-like permease
MSADAPSRPAAPLRRPALGMGSAVLAVVVWGLSSVLIKEVDGVNGVAISAYRLWVGAALTTAVFLFAGGRLTWWLVRTSFWGAVAFAADIVLFFSAVQETSIVNATIIGALQPLLMLAIAGPLFGEWPRWVDGLVGLVAVAGAAIVVGGGDAGGASSAEGDLLAVGALAAWSWYFVASKTARRRLTSFEYLTGLSVVSAVLIVPVPFLLGQPLDEPTAEGWFLIATIAVVNGALGHFLMNWAHGHIPLIATSLVTLGIPVVSALAAALWLDESLVALQLLGMVVVLGALAVVAVNTSRRRPDAAEVGLDAASIVPEP